MKNWFCVFVAVTIILCVQFGSDADASASRIIDPSDSGFGTFIQVELPRETVIHLPDRKFEQAVRELIEKPSGEITAGEVAGIASLSLEVRGITSLEGIEHFTALKELYCGENLLTRLDISQNVLLTKLECYMNKLTTLDVSANSKLVSLYCDENQLSELNVRQNPVLQELSCGANNLTSLDVSQNVELTSLFCYDNKLASLDVSNNPALTIIYCERNQLKTLDVRRNPALTKLFFDGNQLSELDARHNPALESISCPNNFFPDRSAILGLDENKLKRFEFDPQNGL